MAKTYAELKLDPEWVEGNKIAQAKYRAKKGIKPKGSHVPSGGVGEWSGYERWYFNNGHIKNAKRRAARAEKKGAIDV